MNIFSAKQRFSLQAGARPMTDRLFGKEISNISRQRQPSLNRSTADRSLVGKKAEQSFVMTESCLVPCQTKLVKFNFEDQQLQSHSNQILGYMLRTEAERPVNLFETQSEVNESMRGVLVDWLAEVHFKMRLMPETFYLVVQFVDTYLTKRAVKKNRFQLLGVAALYLASKYEETYRIPSLKDLIYLSANTYTKQEIIDMQLSLLEVIEFSVKKTTPLAFLAFFSQLSVLERKDECLAQFLCELSLLESKFNETKSSLLAAGAVYLINKIRCRPAEYNQSLVATTGRPESQIRSCAKALCQQMQCAESKASTKSIRKKFSSQQFYEVARIKIERRNE